MSEQIFNPYLPECTYIPDGEPHVFGDRVYIYGSCDVFNSSRYCTGDYHIYSAPVDNLKNWTLESVYHRKNTHNPLRMRCMWAPDCMQGQDGRYYLYYCFDFHNSVEIAVSDKPGGPFTYYGRVKHQDGTLYGKGKDDIMCFDPGVINDEGRYYLYSGFSAHTSLIRMLNHRGIKNVHGNGNQVIELDKDMMTIISKPKMLIPGRENSSGTGFEGHEMYEASSMRKFNGKYYFIYSSVLSHELAYATSDKPDSSFVYQGALISNGNIGYQGKKTEEADYYWGNNHGSIECIDGKYYLFYHRQTNKTEQARQGCAEPIEMNPDGSFDMVEMTSQGLNVQPLLGIGYYPAYSACVLKASQGAIKCAYGPFSRHKYKIHPCITQEKSEGWKHQYIQNLRDGSIVGFKYFNLIQVKNISVHIRGDQGKIKIYTEAKKNLICTIQLTEGKTWHICSNDIQVFSLTSKEALYFVYEGQGKIDFLGFSLK